MNVFASRAVALSCNRRNALSILSLAAAAAMPMVMSSTARANSGVQLPLNQYQAGSETTQNALITNPGFEQPGVAGPTATGWSNTGPMSVGAPDPARLPTPASAIGSFSAKAGNTNINNNEMYSQSITLQPNTDYVLSAYIWNFAVAHPDGQPTNLGAGDLAVVQLRDDTNFFNTAGMILERQAADGGDGANGYFVYKSFNSSQFTGGVTLEVQSDPNEDLAGARPTIMSQFDNIALTPVSQFSAQRWNSTGGGNWSDATKWLNGVPQNRTFNAGQGPVEGDAIATFGNVLTGAATVNLIAPQSVAVINFDGANSYTIAGASVLTLAHTEERAAVLLNVNQGAHTISAPITVKQPTANGITNFGPRVLKTTVANGATLTLSNDVISSNGTINFNLTKEGGGTLNMKNVRAGRVLLNAGTVGVIANGSNSGASRVGTLTIAGGVAPTATLDLNDNDLIVVNGTAATIRTQIATARAGGAWTGNGITSSAARTSTPKNKGLGLLTGSEYIGLGNTQFDGFTVAATDTLVKFTWNGDTDFNGVVDFDDYSRTDGGFNNNRTGWLNGDFDYNGIVDFDDYSLIDQAFNTQSGTLRRAMAYLDGGDRSDAGMNTPALKLLADHFQQFGDGYAMSFLNSVPEPTSFAVFGGLAALATSRRRRAS
ncbi:MAG: hypothetical protein H7Z14_04175 [Anaerolineae bacterium]|nr:hypothetical protein [Phycisphaerae bacterium]